MKLGVVELVLAVSLASISLPSRAETQEDATQAEWIALGTRIHGAFGAFIPVGIRIGLDARAFPGEVGTGSPSGNAATQRDGALS